MYANKYGVLKICINQNANWHYKKALSLFTQLASETGQFFCQLSSLNKYSGSIHTLCSYFE